MNIYCQMQRALRRKRKQPVWQLHWKFGSGCNTAGISPLTFCLKAVEQSRGLASLLGGLSNQIGRHSPPNTRVQWWVRARFLVFFVALSFFHFDGESRPDHLPLTRAVGHLPCRMWRFVVDDPYNIQLALQII